MFDGRIYRAALVPLLLVIVIAGFSLVSRSAPLGSTLAPDAFDGARAYASLQAMVKRFPDRRPGSAGDDALASYIARSLRELGSPAGAPGAGGEAAQGATAGFQVSAWSVRARTIEGERTLTTVTAERPGSTGASPIVVLAHRDAVGSGAAAELSGTAALLELSRVFSQSETHRTIVLVSTSGGSGGYAGAASFAAHWTQPLDGVLVLGDLAGGRARTPFVAPYSAQPSTAPETLLRTVDSAISQEAGLAPGEQSAGAEFAHFAFPLPTGEQAPLDSAGMPAVLLAAGGPREPAAHEAVSESRLLGFGRAALSAIYALDEGPDLPVSSSPSFHIGGKLLPAWAIRLLVLALLLAPLLAGVNALARLRRRREPLLPWVAWALERCLAVSRARPVRLPARSARDPRGARSPALRRRACRRRRSSRRHDRVRPGAGAGAGVLAGRDTAHVLAGAPLRRRGGPCGDARVARQPPCSLAGEPLRMPAARPGRPSVAAGDRTAPAPADPACAPRPCWRSSPGPCPCSCCWCSTPANSASAPSAWPRAPCSRSPEGSSGPSPWFSGASPVAAF